MLITDAPEGQIPHYSFRSWGSDYGGRQYTPATAGVLKQVLKKFIIVAPYPDWTLVDALCHVDDTIIVKTWVEALQIFETDYPEGARVGVLQDGTMQYIKPAGG